MEIKIAIVEDNLDNFNDFKEKLINFSIENKYRFSISHFASGEDFIKSNQKYEIVFLDIELAGTATGLDCAHEIRKEDNKTIIIFTTKLAQFAIEGYKVDAKGYLVKPINYFDLNMCLTRVLKNLFNFTDFKISVNYNGVLRHLSLSNVYCIESNGHMIAYHTFDELLEVRGAPLKNIAKQLEKYGFYQCHTSYLMNLKYCNNIQGDEIVVNNEYIKISRSKKKEFIDKLADYYANNGKEI